MLTKDEQLQIANTTLQYLGGYSKLKAMVNARDFQFGENGELRFRFTGSTKTNFVCFALNPLDLYDVTFYRIRKDQQKVYQEIHNVYFDQIKSQFEQLTGLYLSL